ncbi:YihY/virulence factor BrkB family protein [Sphingomonas sp.]|uniref:YihY/virulence factor BrkB family protein n=1 Tax=Sphingomonas sp. TaxID=28214 RepID=UPI003CC58EF5
MNTPGPFKMSFAAWKAALVVAWRRAGEDNISLIAAGVGFYAFLAMVPLLGAIVLSYGLFAAPATVVRDIRQLTTVMPADAAKLVGQQLMTVVQGSSGKKGLGLLVALGVALFGARQGAGAIVTALNIAYEEKEKRGFIALNLLSLGITAAAVLVAILATTAIGALGHLQALLPHLPGWASAIGKLVTYLLLGAAGAAGAASLYRWGPSRTAARWVWLTPGSVLTSALWLVLTIGFGLYVSQFGNYNATYGSLATVVVLLTWLYLSAYILLFGAEVNAALEKQEAPAGAKAGEEGLDDGGKKPTPRPHPPVPVASVRSGSSRVGLIATAVAAMWLGRRLGVRKGKRIAARKVAEAPRRGGEAPS